MRSAWDEDREAQEANLVTLKAKVARLQKPRRSSLHATAGGEGSPPVAAMSPLQPDEREEPQTVVIARKANQEDATKAEYLRNVVVSYMEGVAVGNHDTLMPVLTMLLDLTPEEIQRIQSAHGSWLGWF